MDVSSTRFSLEYLQRCPKTMRTTWLSMMQALAVSWQQCLLRDTVQVSTLSPPSLPLAHPHPPILHLQTNFHTHCNRTTRAETLLICASWPACFDFGGRRVGGMSSGGLGQSDIGSCSQLIGGFAKEFYTRNRQHYGDATTTATTTAATTTLAANGSASCRLPAPGCNQTFNLEPHVALNIFEAMLKEENVTVLYGAQVVDVGMAEQAGGAGSAGPKTIASITLSVETGNGSAARSKTSSISNDGNDLATAPLPPTNASAPSRLIVYGKVFIDAGYEGDLLARAGASFVTGREANTTYGESLNGRTSYCNNNICHHLFAIHIFAAYVS